jgi:hypothetical protein
MANQIWKYPLTNDVTTLNLPAEAVILSAHAQDNKPTIWVQQSPSIVTVPRQFICIPTGTTLPPLGQLHSFIGTVLLHQDAFVVHVYEFLEAGDFYPTSVAS